SVRRRRTSHVPSFLRGGRQAMRPALRERRLVIAGIVVLGITLVLQVLLADRARLAADARWRPVVAAVCTVFGCDLPPWREPLAFSMLERDVRAHPTTPGALRVSATFRNDARWPQPWPTLVLTLSDVDGREVGARAFAPEDYLQSAAAAGQLAPGQRASVAFDVLEPAPDIVAFTFDFR
ncbi:MAG TPA: DUF3426 domain-containing protein, partial [Xanthomonadaceae bacterium]|nr:DUF3426 domain-containing protein [Xanthomonadaceae bacterium]